MQGFALKCRNGFNFLDVCFFFSADDTVLKALQIPKAFEGGSEAFLSLLWTSSVTGYDSIRDHIIILHQQIMGSLWRSTAALHRYHSDP